MKGMNTVFEEGMVVQNVHTGRRSIIERAEVVNVTSWADLHPVYILGDGKRYDEKSMEHWCQAT